MEAREQRLVVISPGVYRGVPLTPLASNPETGESHHIVRLVNDWAVESTDVDLLFKDTNLYFIAFRRVVNEVGGQWYNFQEEEVPAFLHSTEIRLGSNHENEMITTIGSIMTLVNMFDTFAFYEGEEPDRQLRRAKARAIITFSEGLRFWQVRRFVAERMEEAPPIPWQLPLIMWNRMRSWRVFCSYLIDAMRRLALPDDDPDHQPNLVQLAAYANHYDIHNFNELIGPNGDIRVIYSRSKELIASHTLEEERTNPETIFPEEPGFGNP